MEVVGKPLNHKKVNHKKRLMGSGNERMGSTCGILWSFAKPGGLRFAYHIPVWYNLAND